MELSLAVYQDGIWTDLGKAENAVYPVNGGQVTLRLFPGEEETRYELEAESTCPVRVRLKIHGTGFPLIPGCMFGDNGADRVKRGEYPLLTDKWHERFCAPLWEFRADRAAMREQIAMANRTQALRLNGTFYRLLSPFEGNDTAWMTVSEDRTEALVTVVRALAQPNVMPPLVRLAGLDAGRRYRDVATGEVYGGDELMKVGLCCPLSQCDAASAMIELKAVDEA